MDCNLYSLRVFVEVVRACSLTRAAAELGISQPAASAHIKTLEQRFGERLLRRGVKGTCLTAFGGEVHGQALVVFAELEELDCLAAGTSTRRAPILGASSTPGAFWLPQMLKKLQQDHSLHCEYHLGDSSQVKSWVLERSVLFGLVGELPAAESQELEQREIGRDSLQLMGASGHALTTKKNLRSVDFRNEILFVRAPGSSTRARSDSMLSGILPHFGRIVELNSGEVIKEAVLAGLGLAVLSSWSVRRELEQGLLSAVDAKRWSQQRPICLIRHARRSLRGQSAFLWDFFSKGG